MATQDRDYYEVLGVPHDADKDTIKKAYHQLAMKWHPDRNKSPEAEEHFKEIAKAYAILKDPSKRARYDAHGMEGVAHFTHDDLFRDFDFSDLFGDIGFGFGGGDIFHRTFGRRTTRPAHGQDLRISIEVPLSVINSGGSQNIKVSHPVTCSACHGHGTRTGRPPEPCTECGGTGRKVVARGEQRGESHVQFQQITVCPICHGRGSKIEEPCETCGGYGQIDKEENLKVLIPAGIDDGTVLRIHGHGLPGKPPELRPGDLHVVVFARSDSRFQRRGADLWHAEVIDVIDAVLGIALKVPTLSGNAKVKVPPGTQPDTILRLHDKGLPRYRQSGRGDLNIRIQVRIPENLNDKERALYEALRKSRK